MQYNPLELDFYRGALLSPAALPRLMFYVCNSFGLTACRLLGLGPPWLCFLLRFCSPFFLFPILEGFLLLSRATHYNFKNHISSRIPGSITLNVRPEIVLDFQVVNLLIWFLSNGKENGREEVFLFSGYVYHQRIYLNNFYFLALICWHFICASTINV